MKVYFIGSGLSGCFNLRCLYPLQANGWDGDRTSFLLKEMTAENKEKAVQQADIVVFHRPEHPDKLKLARILKGMGKKIVFDNDDTYKDTGGFKPTQYLNAGRMERGMKLMNEHIDQFIKEADLVTCSTEFLREEYAQINPNTVVLKNCIDPFYFDEPIKNDTDIIRIGITGSVGVTSDIDVLKPIVEHYQNDPRVQLVLMSLPPNREDKFIRELYSEEYKFWDSMNIERQSFVPVDQYADTLNNLKLDMIIIPRKDNLFNRCKSNVKFLENSMLEIPTIAQSFPTKDSPYEQNVEDTKYLLLADTTEQWIEQIEKLINNKELRLEMGKKAREYVEREYSIENNAHLWKEAYSKLLEK